MSRFAAISSRLTIDSVSAIARPCYLWQRIAQSGRFECKQNPCKSSDFVNPNAMAGNSLRFLRIVHSAQPTELAYQLSWPQISLLFSANLLSYSGG
jgi:hypothetical protein